MTQIHSINNFVITLNFAVKVFNILNLFLLLYQFLIHESKTMDIWDKINTNYLDSPYDCTFSYDSFMIKIHF